MTSAPSQIVYFDGQMDDARINVALATTAAMAGAVVANHVRVVDLSKVCTRWVAARAAADTCCCGRTRMVLCVAPCARTR